MKKLTFPILFSILFFFKAVMSQDIPPLPDPPRLVNDFAGLLSKQEVNRLEEKLVAFSDTNSTQIAIVIVADLGGYDVVDYSQRLAQKWGIGQKKYNNGAIIVLKPKNASGKGEVNIDVGYGLEPLIPDLAAKKIIDNEMIPRFRNNDYYGGLDAAVNTMISLTAGEFTVDQISKKSGKGNSAGIIIFVIIIIIVFISLFGKNKGRHHTVGRDTSSLWTALLLGSMLGRQQHGSWGDFKSGSGGFGGFGGGGGGGFGGFGGGSFGGGGASGSW